jgi:hypothetical protein
VRWQEQCSQQHELQESRCITKCRSRRRFWNVAAYGNNGNPSSFKNSLCFAVAD